MAAYADVDTGSYTTDEYFWKLGQGDKGATPHSKFVGAFDRADRGMRAGNIMTMCIEYPTSGDEKGFKHTSSQLIIDKVTVVLVRDANENVTFNIAHGTNRAGTGSDLLTSDHTARSTTAGETISSFSDASVDTNEHIWLTVTGNSGTIEEMCISIECKVD